jgi:hypothetical protein
MRKMFLSAAAIAALLVVSASTGYADNGQHSGFSSDTQSGQGNLTNDSSNNSTNNGTTTETSTGPKGQLDKGNTDCNNCTSSTDLPGKNR